MTGELMHDVVAEQGVIGSMLINSDVIADMGTLLRPEDFYRPAHGLLFALMVDMFGHGIDVDRMTVLSRLIESGDVTRVGGAPYLAVLTQYANPISATTYAATVADRATDRALGVLGVKATMLSETPGVTADKVAAIQELTDGIAAHREVRRGVTVGDAMLDAVNAIDAARRGDTAAGVIPTPYQDLNRMLGGGFRPGQSVVIGARPGVGKSTVMLDFMREATRNAIPAEVISLEMTVPEIMERFLSAETGIAYSLIRTGMLHPDEEQRLADQVPALMERPLRLTDAPGATMSFIRAQARRGVSRDGLRMIGIDYVGLMPSPPGSESRQLAVADFSRTIKRMDMELGIVSITCSQLNRNPETRTDKRPGLGDLRESGAIEQDADIVILIHDPSGGDPAHARAGEYDLIVAKHRGGPTGTVTVVNQMHRARLADMATV